MPSNDIETLLSQAQKEERAGRWVEAEAHYRRILEREPSHASALYHLGLLALRANRGDDAADFFKRADAIEPSAKHRKGLGQAQMLLGKIEEAAVAFRSALQLQPNDSSLLLALAAALRQGQAFDAAYAAASLALKLQPNSAPAHDALGLALASRGQVEEAMGYFRRAVELAPATVRFHDHLVYLGYFDPGSSAAAILGELSRWNERHAAPLQKNSLPHANLPDPHRRLRVGYVSPNFFFQAECFFVLPLFEAHDRSRFEIYAYSDTQRSDPVTARLRSAADHWIDTRSFDHASLAERIREDRIDILVDLTMHMSQSRLQAFARKPAPIQIAWLAYPGSTGVGAIGHRLTDAHLDPPDGPLARSVDKPLRLPDCWCCYRPLSEPPPVGPLPALGRGHLTFGSLNNPRKLTSATLQRWARVLKTVPRSALLLLCPEGEARQRVQTNFEAAGVSPKRLVFTQRLQQEDYLRLYQQIDLALDPFPYSGITTTCDALTMGVPVLTLPGDLPASRAGLTLLAAAGLTEFVAKDEGDYFRIAAEWAGDLPRLASLRATLRQKLQSSPLTDAPRFARSVETVYRDLWQAWCRETKPVNAS